LKSFSSMTGKTEWRNPIFYGFITIYSCFLIFLAYKLNIWEDEAYSLHTSANNLANVISQAYNFEGQPPFYFILLALWRKIDSGIFFARLFSLLFIGFGSYFFYRIVLLISGFKYSRWLVVIFLVNPFTVWASLEIRLYAFVIFLSTVLIYYFLRFYLENKKKYLYLFLLVALIGLYTQYFFTFEIAALTFAVLIFKGSKAFFNLCLYLIPLIILFIPNLFFVHQQVEMLQSHKLEYNTVHRILAILYSIQELILAIPILPNTLEIRTIVRLIFILLTAYAYFKVYKNRTANYNLYFENINVILLSVSVLVSLYALLFAITGIIFQSKYMAIVFPFFILIFTLYKAKFFSSSLIYSIISVYYILLLVLNYNHPIKNYDFISAGKFVKKIERSKEPVLFYSKSLLPPFTYYYTGPNPLVAIPALKYDDNYYEENIKDTLELKKAIEDVNSPTRSYILLTDNSGDYKYTIDMSQQTIDECLMRNYNITLDTCLLGENKNHTLRIRRLEIK
jgi:hypothetical protein